MPRRETKQSIQFKMQQNEPQAYAGTEEDNIYSGANTFGGVVMMTDLPTSDPAKAGQLWNASGVLTVSAGA